MKQEQINDVKPARKALMSFLILLLISSVFFNSISPYDFGSFMVLIALFIFLPLILIFFLSYFFRFFSASLLILYGIVFFCFHHESFYLIITIPCIAIGIWMMHLSEP
jgi:hypothetical protein